MITDRQSRAETLIRFGVPQDFLDALDDIRRIDDLQYIIRPPHSSYHYLPQIEHYDCLSGRNITPIYDGNNGDSFYILLESANENRFVQILLESEEIAADYGRDFRYMLADLMIKLYEFSQSSIDELAAVGLRLGLPEAPSLLAALELAEREKTRSSFDTDRHWRRENLPLIFASR